MYKIKEKKGKVGSIQLTNEYFVYTQTIDNLEGIIVVENHYNKILFSSEQEIVNRFCINDDLLCYSCFNESVTRIQNIITGKKIIVEDIFYNLTSKTNNIYKNLYYNLSEIDNNIIYDLETGKINQKVENKIAGFIALITSELVITKKDATIYSYSHANFSKVWEQDLSEKLKSIDADGKAVSPHIRGVLQYKDNLIVYSTGGIASLKIHDGTLNWFTKTYATFLIIENNMGYAATNASIFRVNLENGCVISYEGWEYNGMPYIQYEDIEYWVYCGELVFYNGLLWRYSNFNGRSFIVAINPHDGHYEWVHCVDTKGEIDSIQFHQDKMFVSDTSDTLYIYEKKVLVI